MSEEATDRAVELGHEDYTWIDGHPPPDGTYVGCLREFWDYEFDGRKPAVLGVWDDDVEPEKELGAVVLTTTDIDRLVWAEDWERVWFRLDVVDGRIVDIEYDEALTNAHDFEPGDETEVEIRDDRLERLRDARPEDVQERVEAAFAYLDERDSADDDGDEPTGSSLTDRIGEPNEQ